MAVALILLWRPAHSILPTCGHRDSRRSFVAGTGRKALQMVKGIVTTFGAIILTALVVMAIVLIGAWAWRWANKE